MSVLFGTAGNNILTGTTLADLILGGDGNDTLSGLGGDDRLFGGRGTDRLFGGAGRDSLAGGLGIDSLFGGDGDDILSGGNAFTGGNRVEDGVRDVLNGDGGSDLIQSDRLDLALGGNGSGDIDTLSLIFFGLTAQTYALDLRGITTTSATGVNYGLGGARAAQFERVSMSISDANAGSVFQLTGGDDVASVGVAFNPLSTAGVRILGYGGNDQLSGSNADDRIDGGTGDDLLDGAPFGGPGGADTLTGGTGRDVFIFRTPDSASGWTADRITDFTPGQDKILFGPNGFLGGPDDFASVILVRGSTPVSTAPAGQLQVLYDTDDGRLLLDINGSTSGGLVHIATLTGRPALTAADIAVEYDL